MELTEQEVISLLASLMASHDAFAQWWDRLSKEKREDFEQCLAMEIGVVFESRQRNAINRLQAHGPRETELP